MKKLNGEDDGGKWIIAGTFDGSKGELYPQLKINTKEFEVVCRIINISSEGCLNWRIHGGSLFFLF